MMIPKKIAFLGAGNMVRAIVQGLTSSDASFSQSIFLYSRSGVSAEKLAAETTCHFAKSLDQLLDQADVLILGCKPQHLNDLPQEVDDLSPHKLVISLLAGKTLVALRKTFPNARSVIRTMPNTPAKVQRGVTTCACEENLSPTDWELTHQLLSAIGSVYRVDELQMDSLTALGGSGPAFIFEFARALEEGAIKQGLPAELAGQVSKEMILGAATLLSKSDESAEDLRNAVTSPNGTTAAGLAQLAEAQFPQLIEKVLNASAHRSKELSS